MIRRDSRACNKQAPLTSLQQKGHPTRIFRENFACVLHFGYFDRSSNNCAGSAALTAAPATLAIDGGFLAKAKAHPSPAVLAAVRAEADKAMSEGPFSVMDKKDTPPSGDKHDYMSLAPYWWPNPATKDGLPYIRHDGETNPERYKVPDDANSTRYRARFMRWASATTLPESKSMPRAPCCSCARGFSIRRRG